MDVSKIQEADLKGKTVLVRFDHNVVKKGKIRDSYRIEKTLGTIFYIYARGGKCIMMTHVGRPKNKKTGEITVEDNTSVQPIVDYLKEKLNIELSIPEFDIDNKNGIINWEDSLQQLKNEMKNGKIDGVYLPNTRWFAGEESKSEEADKLADKLSQFADIYVNDAFGSWQPHVSTYHLTKYLPSYAGFLMQKELENLKHIYQAKKPFVAVIAGAKFDTKIEPLFALLDKADHLILGGIIYNAYLAAKYGFEINGIEEDEVKTAKRFVEYAEKFPGKLIELPYLVESDTIEAKLADKIRTIDIRDRQRDKFKYILDVDPKSYEEPAVKKALAEAQTIFVNAVMGLTPHFCEGTQKLNHIVAANKQAIKLFAGGDTLQDMKKITPGIYLTASDDPSFYLFTGGGAVLKAIEAGSAESIKTVAALTK